MDAGASLDHRVEEHCRFCTGGGPASCSCVPCCSSFFRHKPRDILEPSPRNRIAVCDNCEDMCLFFIMLVYHDDTVAVDMLLVRACSPGPFSNVRCASEVGTILTPDSRRRIARFRHRCIACYP